jgi:aspartyl-tRNA(Asn)/glutamyl-tRNA(Gln) amidotransferase subunit A
MELSDLPIHILHSKLKKREITILEILDSVISRIESLESNLNAYISLFLDEARERAVELEGKIGEDVPFLYGIPVAIKDNIAVKDYETTCGSKILLGYRSPYNATVVERLLKRGAIIIGKTNLDEFAMGASGEYSYFGPTRNPLNTDYVPGGSSSGSATAVSSGEAIAALGSDTGGSVRQPASFTGVVGLKPTYGRVSRYGLVAFASSLDQIGSLTKDVYDSAILFEAISGYDPKDSTSFNLPVPTISEIFENYEGERFKIGLPKEYFIEGIDGEVERAVLDAARSLEGEGFELKEISLPHTKYSVAVYQIIATSEASSNLARYDGTRYGHRTKSFDNLEEMYLNTRSEGFGDEVIRRILLGTFALSAGYYEAYYLKALKVRKLIREDFDRAFKEVDVVLTPVSPVPPFKIGEKIVDPLSLYLIDIFTVTVNLAGLPAISVPCGYTSDGLPIGLQLIGKPFEEVTLLKVARFYEEKLSPFIRSSLHQ